MQVINVVVLELPYKLGNFAVLVFEPPKTIAVFAHTSDGVVWLNTRNIAGCTLHPLLKHLIHFHFFFSPRLCKLFCRDIDCILNVGLLVIIG